MKIPITYGRSLGEIRQLVSLSFVGHEFHLFGTAIIDTGCPYVLITEPNLRRTRIAISRLDFDKEILIGNIKFELASLGECQLKFIDSDGKPATFNEEVFAGRADIPQNAGFVNGFPNFVGLEFLRKNRLCIIPEDTDGKAYLEKRE